MIRVDSFGNAVSIPTEEAQVNPPGYFTIGNPSLAIPATVVPAWWCNHVQEAIVRTIVASGQTLSKTNYDQFTNAISSLIQNYQEATFSVANNQVAVANITGMLFDKALYTTVDVVADLYRKDTLQENRARVKLTAIYKPVLDTWELIGPETIGEDILTMGVTFSIVAATGQVQYTSSNYTGGSYVGELRFKLNRFKL